MLVPASLWLQCEQSCSRAAAQHGVEAANTHAARLPCGSSVCLAVNLCPTRSLALLPCRCRYLIVLHRLDLDEIFPGDA